MYLLVIVTLIVGVLGVYAQVLSLQAARLASLDTSLATAMITWHNAAVSMAGSVYYTAVGNPMPCSLTRLPFKAGFQLCLTPRDKSNNIISIDGAWGTVTALSGGVEGINNRYYYSASAKEAVDLPQGFQFSKYQFYSIFYKDANSNQPFVVTYVPMPTISANNPPPGYLVLAPTQAYPNGVMVSVTAADLLHQLKTSGLQSYAYGTIKSTAASSSLTGPATFNTQYALQNVNNTHIPDGSVAIISSPVGF